MEDFELFATQEEARAFVKGVEMAVNVLDSDHLVVEAPYQVGTGEWRVDYTPDLKFELCPMNLS